MQKIPRSHSLPYRAQIFALGSSFSLGARLLSTVFAKQAHSAFLVGLLCLFCSAVPLAGQVFSPIKWTFSSTAIGGDEFELVFHAEIEPGWFTYSQFLTSDEGPVRTSVTFESDNAALLGKSTEEGHKIVVEKDPIFEIPLTKFKDQLTIRQRVKISDYSRPVNGYVNAMCCDDQKCLPPKDFEFSFFLKK